MFSATRCALSATVRRGSVIRGVSNLSKSLVAASNQSGHVVHGKSQKLNSLDRANGTVGEALYTRVSYYSTSEESKPVLKRISELIKEDKIVVFMKGTPEAPRCGFSNAVMQILRMHGVKNFKSHNVLEDDGLRQGIKEFSNWPTIPQVFINGEFVGGCDIMIEMHQKGELVEELQKVGVRSALLDKPAPDSSN